MYDRALIVASSCLMIMIVVGFSAFGEDPTLVKGVRQIADEHAVETSERALQRIQQTGEPRFSFVQVADAHHRVGEQSKNNWLHRALTYINKELQPAFVIFSGDNLSGDSVAHQKQLRSFFQTRLEMPVHLIRGDNDEEHFNEVFGSSKWRFNFGGVHFMGTSIDVDEAPGKGTGFFSTETIDWMKRDLSTGDRPTVVFLHENVWPPTFADAPRLAHLLRSDGDVVMLATGHLHRDLEVDVSGLTQIVAPSVRLSTHHGIKEYRVYSKKLVIVTHDTRNDGYSVAPKYQEVNFNSPLPEEVTSKKEQQFDHLPPQEMTYSNTLEWFRRTVESRIMQSLLRKLWNEEENGK